MGPLFSKRSLLTFVGIAIIKRAIMNFREVVRKKEPLQVASRNANWLTIMENNLLRFKCGQALGRARGTLLGEPGPHSRVDGFESLLMCIPRGSGLWPNKAQAVADILRVNQQMKDIYLYYFFIFLFPCVPNKQ